MIAVKNKVFPGGMWTHDERCAVAKAIQAEVYRRINTHQPLTEREIIDVTDRLCILINQDPQNLEALRDAILVGVRDEDESS